MAVLTDLLDSIRLLAAWPGVISLRGEACVAFETMSHVTLHCMLTGSSRVRAEDGCFEHRLEPGQYLFVPPGIAQVVGGASREPQPAPVPQRSDRIAVARFGEGPPTCTIITAELEIDQARLDAVVRIMPEIRRHVPEGAPTVFDLPDVLSVRGLQQTILLAGGPAVFRCAAETMLVNAVRERITSGKAEGPATSAARTAPVAAAMRLMYRHPEKPWTLAMLAGAAGASRSVLASAFAQQVGTTPIAYLMRIRMMRAETLLRDDRYPLNQIASLCGYRSDTAFSRAFRAHAEMSPGAWRRAMRPPGQSKLQT